MGADSHPPRRSWSINDVATMDPYQYLAGGMAGLWATDDESVTQAVAANVYLTMLERSGLTRPQALDAASAVADGGALISWQNGSLVFDFGDSGDVRGATATPPEA